MSKRKPSATKTAVATQSRRPPVTDDQVLSAIKLLQSRNEVVSLRRLFDLVGGSFGTLSEILQRLADQKLISTPIGRERLLRACLARRSEQLEALMTWAADVARSLKAQGSEAPPLPHNLGPAKLGSSSWPYPGADERDEYVVGQDEGSEGQGKQGGIVWLSYDAHVSNGVRVVDASTWAVGPAVPSSATIAQSLAAALHLEGVSAPAVDTRVEASTRSAQVFGTSDCALMDTPTEEVTRTSSEQQRRQPDRRSVRRHHRQDSPRHADQRGAGQEGQQ